jgi:hypothetical protein
VAGAIVVFTTPSRGASGLFANGSHTLTVTTDDSGRAVARGLQPNGARGQYQIHVNASYRGQTAKTDINQTNAIITAAGTVAASGGHGTLITILAAAGAAAAVGIAVGVSKSNSGNTPTTAPAVLTTVTAGTSTVGPPR